MGQLAAFRPLNICGRPGERKRALVGIAEMKALFPAVDKVGRLHVFDIGGNKIRLIALVRYDRSKVFIKAILDHAEYDRAKWKG